MFSLYGLIFSLFHAVHSHLKFQILLGTGTRVCNKSQTVNRRQLHFHVHNHLATQANC